MNVLSALCVPHLTIQLFSVKTHKLICQCTLVQNKVTRPKIGIMDFGWLASTVLVLRITLTFC
jgi:hypothetical protein